MLAPALAVLEARLPDDDEVVDTSCSTVVVVIIELDVAVESGDSVHEVEVSSVPQGVDEN